MSYNIVADYHTHTLYSHGTGTISENVEAARKKGLKKIAITDHGFRHILYGLTKEDVHKMRGEIDAINSRYDDIEVLLGIEANLIGIDGEVDIYEEYMDFFDIVLMGFHHGVLPPSLGQLWQLFGRNMFSKIVPIGKESTRYAHTVAMIRAMERYPIDVITHPGAKIDMDSKLLARGAKENNVALEINAGHGYMTVDYIKVAMEEGASFVINSDAHTPERVGDFARAVAIAKEAGVDPAYIINAEGNL